MFSPIVLVGGLVVAATVGYVAARQLGGPAEPTSPSTVASSATGGTHASEPFPSPASREATEGTIEPFAEDHDVEKAETRQAAAAPAVRSAPSRAAQPPPAPQARASAPAPARSASVSRTPPASQRDASAASRVDNRPVETARAEPTFSRPFPSPEAANSLPTRTAPAIDAPPPPPLTRSVTLAADSVVGIQIERTVSSDTAAVEDSVQARVTRDVLADGVVVIPAGTRVNGSVTFVDEGGKVRERARLGVRFHTLVLADGTELRLRTETIYRDGESPTGRSAAKIGGGATAGAVIGAILGGGKGAAIGAAVGAGGGTAATMAGERRPATLPAGQVVTVRLSDPVSVDVER